jgi:hypothetical protein
MPATNNILERLRWKVGLGLVVAAAAFGAHSATTDSAANVARSSWSPSPVQTARSSWSTPESVDVARSSWSRLEDDLPA